MKDTGTSQKDFAVAIHRCIKEVPHKEWDTLVQNTMFHTVQWMELVEHSVREDVTPYYITVICDDQLVGGGVCYTSYGTFWKVRMKRLACMCLFSENMALFVKEEEDTQVLSLVYSAVEEIAQEQKVQMVVIPYVSGEVANFLMKKGFTLMKEEPTARLDVKWKSFTEYLRSLKRKSKKNIRHTLNQGERRGITLEHSHDFSDADNLFRLYAAHLERHQYEHAIPFTGELFKNFEKYVPEHAYIVRCSRENDLLGYWIYFFDGNSATMAMSGMDYAYAREYDAYFNICYDAVREMIEKGCSHIRFGASTYRVKRRIGCDLIKITTAVKFINPVLNVGYEMLVLWRNFLMEKRSGMDQRQ